MRSGFTLVELITTVAVIAVLAAVALPVIGRARRSAQFNRGVSNLRQWNTAMLLHAGDNRGFLAHQGFLRDTELGQASENQTVKGVKVWYNALPPYLGERSIKERAGGGVLPKFGDNSVWVCPASQDIGVGGVAWLSYAPSVGLSNPGGHPLVLAQIDRIAEPARTPLFAETTNNSSYRRGRIPPWFLNVTPGTPSANPIAGLALENRWGGASGKACVGFCDGSVRAFTAAQLREQARRAVRPEGLPEGAAYTGGDVHWRVFR